MGDMVDRVVKKNMVDNGIMVNSIDMANMQNTFDYLKLLVDTSGWTRW